MEPEEKRTAVQTRLRFTSAGARLKQTESYRINNNNCQRVLGQLVNPAHHAISVIHILVLPFSFMENIVTYSK